jgi:metal-responsive CopG/Arc/MetJ family transcriptional regulator
MGIKTAISMNKDLFEQVNKLADKLKVSRSHLFAMAVEEFIERHENRLLLQQINQAYESLSLADDEQISRGIKRFHRNLREGEW